MALAFFFFFKQILLDVLLQRLARGRVCSIIESQKNTLYIIWKEEKKKKKKEFFFFFFFFLANSESHRFPRQALVHRCHCRR